MPILNLTADDDYIIPSNNGTTYRGLAGNDTYILSENTIVANAKITIVDTVGVNKIQLVDGLSIASSIFAADAIQLTLSNGAVVTINGASNFTFDVGGNATSGTAGTSNTLSAFAASMGVATLPASGSTAGSANVTVSGSAVSSSASPTYTLTKSATSVDEGSSVTFTITASSSVTADTEFVWTASGSDDGGTVDKATTTADLDANSGSAIISSGGTSTSFTVTALADSIAEGIEGIKITVFFKSNSEAVGSATILINSSASAGTSGDDDLTLTSADDVFEVTQGSDKIDGGEGTDTLVIDSAENIIYGTDKTGSMTGTPGRDFVYVRLGDDSSKYTVATDFEKIQTSKGTWNINEFSFVGYFGLGSGKTISNQSISNNDSTQITLSDHLYHNNHSSQVGISYSIESDNDKLSDQILLNDGVVTLTAGSTGESYTATVTVTAKLVDGKANIDESWSGATLSKTFTVTMADDDFVDGKTGTSSDDNLTLTDGDDVFELTTGLDSIDGGAGEDTVVVPSGTTIYHAVNTRGESLYGNEIGDKFLFINLEGEDLWTKSTFATNFEYIQIKGEDTKTAISDYTAFSYFDVRSSNNDTEGVAIANQVIADNTETTLNLDDNFFTLNVNASLSYTVSFSNDKITDQITVSGTNLSFKGGTGGDTYEVSVAVRATQTLPEDVTIADSDMYEENSFTVTLSDDDYVAVIAATDTTPNASGTTTIEVTEDIIGGVLLDLTSLNIDSGTAIISNWGPNGGENLISLATSYLFIDHKVLKLKDMIVFNVDRSELTNLNSLIYFPNSTDGPFSIDFTYKSNGIDKEHKVLINNFVDTPYGSGLYSDGAYAYYTDDDYKTITATNTEALESGSYLINTKDNSSDTIEIFYSFVPNGYKYINDADGLEKYYQSTDSRDKIIDPTAGFKDAVYDILSMTSQFLKIKFTELTGSDIEKSAIRFVTWESTADIATAGYATRPSDAASYVFIYSKDSYEKGTWAYETILHEFGHALGLKHPFVEYRGFEKISSLYNSTQYTLMAYESVFNTIVTNPYNIGTGYVSIVKNADTGKTVGFTQWSMLDLSALGTHYGIKADYNVGDNVYTFEGTSTFTVIHDMGGYDTIDLSNWSNDNNVPEEIDLGGGAFFQVGSSKLIWKGDDVYTGQVVTTSLYTQIEKFIGSSGDDRVIAGPTTENISTGSGSDTATNLTTSMTVDLGADKDYAYITIDNTDQINSSININGGSGYDYLSVKFVSVDTIDLTLFRTHFDNFELYSFADSKSQEITIDINDFVTLDEGMILGIIGDEDDKVILPEGATQTNSDDSWLYYTLNDVQIAISDEMLIG